MNPRYLLMYSPDDGGGAAPAPAPAASPAPAAAPAPAERTVSHDVYRRVVDAKQGLEAQVSTLKDEVATLSERAATADTLAEHSREWQSKAEAAEGKFTRWRAIADGLGTTETEAIEAAEWAHSRLPEADRPEIGEWAKAMKAAPDTAPKVLAGWLAGSAAPAPAPAGAPRKPAPKNPAGSVQQPGAPAAVSAESFRAAREKGARSGDWSDFKALKKAAGYRTA